MRDGDTISYAFDVTDTGGAPLERGEPGLSGLLGALWTQYLATGAIDLAPRAIGDTGLVTTTPVALDDADRVAVDIYTDSLDPLGTLQALEALGLENGVEFGGMIGGWLPVAALGAARETEGVLGLSAVLTQMATGSIDGEGDEATFADDLRELFGIDGTGVTVGIISDSFDTSPTAATSQADDVASGDLNPDITILEDGVGGTIDEGRAMAQLVADIAPGAAIQFHTALGGQANFAQGIIDLAEAGSDVIVDDIIYFAEPAFQDGIIAQAANTVVDDYGVPYFSSAGNNGRDGYEADFSVGPAINAFIIYPFSYDFDQGPTQNFEFAFTLEPGETIFPVLQWTDPIGNVATDLDLYLRQKLSPTIGDNSIIDASIKLNSVEPFEIIPPITNVGNAPAELALAVAGFSGPVPEAIKIVNFGS